MQRDQAAFDDAGGASVARAAGSGTAPGTDRDACAEAAPPHPNGELHEVGGNTPGPETQTKSKTKRKKISGGEFPLPSNASDFVEEIHRRIDLFEVWQRLLESKDDKLRQRAVEKLTEMRYKGAAAMADEPRQIIIDMPGPNRD